MKYTVRGIIMWVLTLSSISSAELSIMTYNVYFDDTSGNKDRYANILKQIKERNPNVIALQEVTPNFLGQLAIFSKANGYTLVGDVRGDYGVVILANIKVESSEIIRIPSRMGRYALSAKLVNGNRRITVITTHLESMMNDTERRKIQISTILESLPKTDVILLGDCNFGDGEPENEMLKSLTDAAGTNTTPTYNVENNGIARNTKFENETSRRLDRVFLSKDCKFDSYVVHQNENSDHYAISLSLK